MLRDLGISVVGGLIVLAIGSIVAWLWIVNGIDNPVSFLFSFINIKLSIPLYITITASIVLAITLFRKVLHYSRGTSLESKAALNPYDPFAQDTKINNLSKTEKAILKLFGQKDGEGLVLKEISEMIGENNIRTQVALDALYEVKLVDTAILRVGGILFSLSSDGRSAVVKLGYDQIKP